MTSSFQSYLPYLPYMILGFLATAGALLLRVLYAYSSTVRKTELLKHSLKAPLSFFNHASPQTSEHKNQDAGVPKKTFYERSKFFLTNFWRSSDQEELSLSFQEAMKILKEHFATRNFRYKLPWYLMTGAVDSGKTKILEDL
ncbi:MAG: hypothetical protein IBJ00_01295 [Alphaproteobacteria bacterium]|nr:hypothetical protein [Alphaproteobacteria bacterium]